MADFNKEALSIWNSIKPVIDKEIDRKTDPMVQRRKVAVSTAPNPSTGLIGVKEPFGSEFFVPYREEVSGVAVGDTVWIEFAYGANNAVAIGLAGLVDAKRSSYAILSSVGWYRVFEYDAASSLEVAGDIAFTVDINLLEWTRQCNKITLYGILSSSNEPMGFGDEVSRSAYSTLYFDQIRYTRNGSKGFIDVHYNIASTRYMACYFDVKTSWSSGPSPIDMQNRFKSINFDPVADSPTGETVLSTYDFVGTSGKKIDFTPTSGSSHSTFGGCWYAKQGNIVQLHVGISGLTANTLTTIFTMPTGFIPQTFQTFGGGYSTYQANLVIQASGTVQITSGSQYACVDATYFVQ